MAETRRFWTTLALLVFLPAAAAVCAAGQSSAPASEPQAGLRSGQGNGLSVEGHSAPAGRGILVGKLTDLHAVPVGGAAVVLRNLATGAEARVLTERNGSFRVGGLAAGAYALEATRAGLGRGQLEELYVSEGKPAKVQIALLFQPEAVLKVPDASPVAEREGEKETAPVAKTAGRAGEEPPGPELFWKKLRTEEMPVVTASEVAAPLPAVRLRGLDVRGQPVSQASRVIPKVSLAVVSAGLDGIAPETLQIQGHAAAAGARDAEEVKDLAPKLEIRDEPAPTSGSSLTATEMRWQDFLPDATGAGRGAQGGHSETGGQGDGGTNLDGMATGIAFGVVGRKDNDWAESSGQTGRGQSGLGRAWSGGSGSPVAEAAVRIVRSNSSGDAAQDRKGRVEIETARGRNGLHGQGFVFDRQNTWGARNPFTEWVKETTPGSLSTTPAFAGTPYTPPDHELVWGAGAGSQLKRDRLFWFGAFDSYRRNDPGLATVKHPEEFFAQPSNDQMQVLSARLGLSGTNPVAAGLAAYSQMLETLDGLLGPAPRAAEQWVGFGRLDWRAAERHRLSLEGTGGHWDAPGGGFTRISAPYGIDSFGNSRASQEMLMGRWEAFLTPNLLAVSEGAAGRNVVGTHAEAPSAYEKTFLTPNVWGQLPQMVVDSRYGLTIGNPSRFGTGSYPDERSFQLRESMDWVRGGLLVRSGFQLEHNQDTTNFLRNQTGTYSYASVENFASDALAFANFGDLGELNPDNQHNCDATGKAWRDAHGGLHGLGYLPCYSYYSQVLGPSNWTLSTNEWAGFSTVQWKPQKLIVVSGGLRWEREQLPPPIAAVRNPELPLTEKLPSLGNDWGPRVSVAVGSAESHAPVLRLGYGMYFERAENQTVETVLTHTGSTAGDLNFFMRPTDNLQGGGAPPFPKVLSGLPGSMVKPGAVEFAPDFRLPEVHQSEAAIEESLPGHWQVTASGVVSLGRRLPVSIDTNFDRSVNPGSITYAVVDGTGAGPIKTNKVTVPFYASWPSPTSGTGFAGRANANYQQISDIMSRANSTYEAAIVRLAHSSRRGVSVHAQYTYAHAMDWNPNESTSVAGSDVLDPEDFKQEYGTGDLDVRHTVNGTLMMSTPWKVSGVAGRIANGWRLSTIGHFRSGLPFTMRTSGSLAEEFDALTGAAIVGLAPGMNGSGGDNRVIGVGRNTYRYPATWKADVRVGKTIDFGALRQLELLVESFNLFNHQNVTELETTGYYLEPGSPDGTPPTLNFLTGVRANSTAFGAPLDVNATDFYRERQIQVGVRMRF